MAKIQVLEKQVAELVAAGEVVERPASVVKELMENAIDAGSTAITVEIRGGGIAYIRVTDNGCGIPAEEVPLAFLRHATSKITTADDLEAIGTLGFRGEALAAISTVSKVELMTKTAESLNGCRAVLEGGNLVECYETGCRDGTTIIVRDLFFNTPARLKFLKRDVTEANAVTGIVERAALSHPEVSVRFFRDGKETLYTPGNGKLFSAVYSVLGKNFAADLSEVHYEREGVTVSGFLSKPFAAQATRNMQMFFLNGRSVRSRTAQAAIEEAYRNTIATGHFPGCVLHIGMDLRAVDVNIHPAKTEVRFVNEKPLFNAIYFAAKSVLEEGKTLPKFNLTPAPNPFTSEVLRSLPAEDRPLVPHSEPPVSEKNEPERSGQPAAPLPYLNGQSDIKPEQAPPSERYEKPYSHSVSNVSIDITCDDEADANSLSPDSAARLPLPDYRFIGEVFASFILLETGSEFLLIDKHAAHERILFEQLSASTGEVDRQALLMPIFLSLSGEEKALVMENLPLLQQAGFVAEDLGGSIILRELPAYLDAADAPSALAEIVAGLAQGGSSRQTRRLDDIHHITACKAAIKAGSRSDPKELEELVREVLTNPKIRYCPHGRPVMVTMTKYELDKRFGRV